MIFGKYFMRRIMFLMAGILILVPVIAKELLSNSEEKTYRNTVKSFNYRLNRMHLNKLELNDELSKRFYAAYFDYLDPNKRIFLQKDIEAFRDSELLLDDQFKRGNVDIAFEIYDVFEERILERQEYVLNLIDDYDFDFKTKETYQYERSEWPTTNAEAQEIWRKVVKNLLINDLLADESLENAKESIHSRFTYNITQLKNRKNDDVFQSYLNAFASLYDPHTQYMTPEAQEDFDISMSLSLTGIGAELQQDRDKTIVNRLIENGPAFKSKELQVDDRIIEVAQGNKDFVDIRGMRLRDVVKLIRGEEDSTVRLKVEQKGKIDQIAVISIIRKKVTLEEQSTQSDIQLIERDGKTLKLGVIDIPSFYMDFGAYQRGEADYKSTTRDVQAILKEFKDQQVDGILIDLRNNGGGSLSEAIGLTGLFIDKGPVVQISAPDYSEVQEDQNPGIAYDGPMVVLVNRLSASASEIFAAAMQDYQRAVVVGQTTYGKGTVQTLTELKYGEIKLTQAKFYRISGDSTQHKGVVPDIELPAILDAANIGESSLDNALVWDKIAAAKYKTKRRTNDVTTQLALNHQQRFNQQSDWQPIMRHINEHRSDNQVVSLNLEQRRQTRAQEQAQEEKLQAQFSDDEKSIYEFMADINKQASLEMLGDWAEFEPQMVDAR